MATYNGARFLPEQLASLAAQTLLPAEMVVTDDASTDDTLRIVRDFAATAPFPVHVHRNAGRLGYRANFMRAMGLCAGELVAPCDQDDVWAPAKFARMAAVFDEPDVLLAYHDAWLADAAGTRLERARMLLIARRSPPSEAFPLKNPYGFSMMFRRRLLAFSDLWPSSVDNLHPNEPMAHDQWLFFLASALGTVGYLDEPLADYRLHGGNTYGFRRPAVTRRARARDWLFVRSRDFAGFAVAAANRAAILERATDRLTSEERSRAGLAIRRYGGLARHSAARSRVYDAPGPAARLAAWIGLWRDGGYGNANHWLFGRKAALRDLGYLLPPRRLLAALLSAPKSLQANGDDAHPPL